jgi:tetratricopeptide (TPR) repeat protein
MVQAQRGDRAQAIQAQHESLRLQPGYVPALYELGALYHAQGEHAKSREAYDKLRKLDRQRAAQFRARYLR